MLGTDLLWRVGKLRLIAERSDQKTRSDPI